MKDKSVYHQENEVVVGSVETITDSTDLIIKKATSKNTAGNSNPNAPLKA